MNEAIKKGEALLQQRIEEIETKKRHLHVLVTTT